MSRFLTLLLLLGACVAPYDYMSDNTAAMKICQSLCADAGTGFNFKFHPKGGSVYQSCTCIEHSITITPEWINVRPID